jgi:hypothetical protein
VTQASQSISTHIYFNAIYHEELEKKQAFLTRNQYLNYLKVLVDVHAECGVSHPNGLPWRRNVCELHKYAELNPPSTIYELIVRIKTLSINYLFAAEAASRVEELKPCVKFFIKEWRKANFFPIPIKKINALLRDDPLFTTVDRVIKDIHYKSRKIPELWLPYLSEFTMTEMRTHLTGLETLIFREASTEPYSEEEILAYLKKSAKTQDVACAVMLHRYARDWTHFSLKENQMEDASDPCIYLCLLLMNHLQFLDLSGCHSLTRRCLQDGHPTLETLVLHETGIDLEDIDRSKFPALKMLLKDVKLKESRVDKKSLIFKKKDSYSTCAII